ncbi:axonemal 84 kDa -like isoform X1 [Brachionus plicatilis]|uniref:Axonemal 84 kDa-like isoform X1 n=1 Tax=Brachionus plicatilis TaxID=10195 RepID=A0A3M7RSQ5_BRAPC|nr:axonemal 84 kDa -like isoform X1 [Brachionus plicatilis]
MFYLFTARKFVQAISVPDAKLRLDFFLIRFDQLRIYVPTRPPTEEDTTKEQKKSKQSLNKQTKPEKPTRLDYENQNPNPSLMKVIEPVANKWFKLREFKALLISLGLNIFPEPDSEKFVTITNKNKKLEWISYRNMALCSCLISMAYSKWNGDVDAEDTIIMLYQEHTKDKEPKQDLYKCLISTTDVFYVSESTENSDDLDQTKAQGTQEHSNMYHLCLEDICKNDKELVYTRVNEIDPLYFETCLNFLESLKVLTFS